MKLLTYSQSVFPKLVIKKFGNCYLKQEIKKRSKQHLSYLRCLIDKKNEFPKEQMRLLVNKHIKYLKNEYFKIIQLACEENQLQKAYSDMISILDMTIEEDKANIEEMYKSFIQKIELQRKMQKSNTKEVFLQGSNYSMKEAENTKEIMISIEIDKDLESEIEQDF